MLSDWETHPDQKAGLSEIEALLREFPCDCSELIQVYRREAQFFSDSGGTKGILQEIPVDQTSGFLLREPFDKLTVGELLELPYDEESEVRRRESQLLGSIEAVRERAPLVNWPGFVVKPSATDLDAYRKRPNGLGDLLEEHPTDIYHGALTTTLFQQPSMETCIAWLRAEGEGKIFTQHSDGVADDPVTGKPLKIEPGSRRIRSVGADLELADLGDLSPDPGIQVLKDDRIIKVPSWRKDGD
ncbi:hypothetical protein [Luteolibacter flavescens]|nr:hypothetical protein [Luteolibacter flavescens]